MNLSSDSNSDEDMKSDDISDAKRLVNTGDGVNQMNSMMTMTAKPEILPSVLTSLTTLSTNNKVKPIASNLVFNGKYAADGVLIQSIQGTDGSQLKLRNVVSVVNMGRKINLSKISRACRNTEYNPDTLNALVMRIRSPRTTALIFDSGRMITTGAQDERLCRMSARKYARILWHYYEDIEFKDFRILNMVATFDLKWPLNLSALYTSSTDTTYEPELFPALVYKLDIPFDGGVQRKVTALIFMSGNVVITGGKCRQDLIQAVDLLVPILMKYRKIKSNQL